MVPPECCDTVVLVSGKDKANIATQGSFALGFPEFSKEQSLARRPDLTAAIARFEKWMDDTNSPVRAVRKIAARAAVTADIPQSVAAPLRTALAQRGIRELYSHQAECFALTEAGKNVVVVTPTASGKTLCYNLPVLNRILNEPGARAMYLFPDQSARRGSTPRVPGGRGCDGLGYQSVHL